MRFQSAPHRRARAMKRFEHALVWFRRDLRIEDHAALYHALKDSRAVHCAFIFDTEILDALPTREDRRVEFLWSSAAALKTALEENGGTLHVLHGRAREVIPELAEKLDADAVYANHDYEPLAARRDAEVRERLEASDRAFYTFKDQVVFEKDELLTAQGKPYTVFTPYKRAWLEKVTPFYLKSYPTLRYRERLARAGVPPVPSLHDFGFRETNLRQLKLPTGSSGAKALFTDFLGRIDRYHEKRDYPSLRGPSYLSVHLRFGTISIRELARKAIEISGQGAAVWLSELIWRDFYFGILHHFPYVATRAFRSEYDSLAFENSIEHFRAWCEARTGYPIVDAAMRQINHSGYMHNRLRMIVASFLVKDLHVDWRWGEGYFANQLNDFDLAANNGGWQWSASTGCDAQPYFRIFNPVTQSKKFDPGGRFIRSYLPELSDVPDQYVHEPWTMPKEVQVSAGCRIGSDYPLPIVDHASARKKTLELYGTVKRRQANSASFSPDTRIPSRPAARRR